MGNSIPNVPLPANEPILGFAPGSSERAELKAKLDELVKEPLEIPLYIGGELGKDFIVEFIRNIDD